MPHHTSKTLRSLKGNQKAKGSHIEKRDFWDLCWSTHCSATPGTAVKWTTGINTLLFGQEPKPALPMNPNQEIKIQGCFLLPRHVFSDQRSAMSGVQGENRVWVGTA